MRSFEDSLPHTELLSESSKTATHGSMCDSRMANHLKDGLEKEKTTKKVGISECIFICNGRDKSRPGGQVVMLSRQLTADLQPTAFRLVKE